MQLELHLRDDILEYFPNFEYFNCKETERLDFNRADNLVGMQQEAFINYWILQKLEESADGFVGVDLGCGQNIHFACIGINNYYGNNHPIYKGGPYRPHITSLAEDISCLNEDVFSVVVASHILEHINEPIVVFRKWCKLLKSKGIMILLMPDANFERPGIGSWDPTHINFYTPRDFQRLFLDMNKDLLQTIEFNNLNNNFSMNFVGRRI